MMTLALEFSSPIRSAALLRSLGNQDSAEVVASVADEGSRAVTGLGLVDRLLKEAGVSAGSVQAAVIGLGPGSYTGIRSSIAIAQGWQLAREIRLHGVSSVECLAYAAQAKAIFGRVSIAVDAQRGEVYLATYRIEEHRRELIAPLRLAPITALEAALSEPDSSLIGPEIQRWSEKGCVLWPEAALLGHIAPLSEIGVRGEHLEPIYLRETTFVKAAPGQMSKACD